jgi:hypothetical protein
VAYVYQSHKTLEYIDSDWLDDDPHDGHRRLLPKAKPRPIHKWWTQVQKLYPSDPHAFRLFGDEVSIWGDVISIMAEGIVESNDWSDATNSTYQFGSVYMYTRSRTDVDAWTQQQKLYNPDADDGIYFHESVDDNYQNFNTSSLANNRFALPRLHGSFMSVTSSSQFGYMMTDTVVWKCLLISVSDGMGDGWDKARLVATAPTDPLTREVKHDTYSQYCDAYNYGKNDETKPLSRKLTEVYRYCPLSAEDEGDYVFEVMGNPRGKKGNKGTPSDDLYWREIYWEIYNEFDRKTYRGDAHTKLTFNWGRDDFFFTENKIEREFKPPATCSQCNVWEGLKSSQRKPKPADFTEQRTDALVTRRLNLYPTPAPTISRSPTMTWDTSITDQWTFYMGRDTSPTPTWGSTTAWFDKSRNGTGTYFYIYDSNGQNITEPLMWGQLCELTGTIADSCETQLLPVGGTYTLRVTGGTDYRRDEIQWKFCNRIGTAMQSLVFTKYSSTCLPIAQYSSVDLCEKNGFIVYTSVSQVLNGLVGLYSESRDSSIVAAALKTMLLPYIPSKVQIFIEEESMQGNGAVEDVVLRAELEFDSEVNGIAVKDLDGLHNFEVSLAEKLTYFDENNLISSTLNTAAHDLLGDNRETIMYGSTFESHITSVKLVSAEPKPMILFHDRVRTSAFDEETSDNSGVSDFVAALQLDHDSQLEYNILNFEAIAGYVMLVCVVIGAVLVSWRRQVKKSRQLDHNFNLEEPLGAEWGKSSVKISGSGSHREPRV